MTNWQLTAQQQAVVDSPSKNLVIRAGAGSGKTSVLVARYLKHIEQDNLRPDQILAITYTRKAAGEMKVRIVDRLKSIGRTADAQIAESGPISTLHSFCSTVLRENALVAGLNPAFDRVTDVDRKHDFIEATEDALTSLAETNLQIADLLQGGSAFGRLESEVTDQIDRVIKWLRLVEGRWPVEDWIHTDGALLAHWQESLARSLNLPPESDWHLLCDAYRRAYPGPAAPPKTMSWLGRCCTWPRESAKK